MRERVVRATASLLAVILTFSIFPSRDRFSTSAAAADHAAYGSKARADYSAVIEMLGPFIERQMADHGLPAVSVALVDDQQIVWSKGFGYADPAKKIPATGDTVYRVGSVSKLFTDLAVMQLVEKGQLDLDAPVTRYLPAFRPENPYRKPITLRQMMSHRSGLVREPPVGNYFDPTEPTLARTIASLNRTKLIYAPESRAKYSNAAIAAVGYVLERTQRQPFAKYLKNAVLDPLGLERTSFEPTPSLIKNLAKANMWTIDGRVFPAPTFELGIAPAGCMYTTVNDMGRFISALFSGGRGMNGQLITQKSLDEMWTPQYVKPGEKRGYGIGFGISDLDGRRRIGHGGAIYGFSTELAALPDDKLGVVVVATKDTTNAITTRIADFALRGMLAVRRGEKITRPELTRSVGSETVRKAVGRYLNGTKGIDLFTSAGKLWMLGTEGGLPLELRASGDGLVADGGLGFGLKVDLNDDSIVVGRDTYRRVEAEKPSPASAKWTGLIGEYGWDHDVLYILEKDGKLWALIEWIEFDPLEQVSENVFRFPDRGLYAGERLIFSRGKDGKATRVEAASVVFKRRNVGPEGTGQLRIKPVRPVSELLKEALTASPPTEKGEFRRSDLVEVAALDPTIRLDVRYATTNNFLGNVFYSQPKAFMQRPAAEALVRINANLRKKGYGLLIHDAYRPWYVTKVFWDATPDASKIFVADPSQGSRHNRGMAVDLTLYELETGKPVEMVGTYDELSDRSYPDYPGGTSLQRWHRSLLRDAMEADGFTIYDAEWWHFDFRDWRRYPIGNEVFEHIGKSGK